MANVTRSFQPTVTVWLNLDNKTTSLGYSYSITIPVTLHTAPSYTSHSHQDISEKNLMLMSLNSTKTLTEDTAILVRLHWVRPGRVFLTLTYTMLISVV